MKRKEATLTVLTDTESIRKILNDPASFVTNWPYVVKVNTKKGVVAEIMLPRFLFKFRDVYTFTLSTDYNSYIYEGVGEKSSMIVVITLKESSKNVQIHVEISYSGRGEFLLGKPLQILANGIAKSIEELVNAQTTQTLSGHTENIIYNVDFSDPMSVAKFLSKAKMMHSGLHIVPQGGLFDVIAELRKSTREDVLYVSGIVQDGSKSFKMLLHGSQIVALEYREGGELKTVKVENEEKAKEVVDIASNIEGAYMINVWVPVGGI